MSVHPADGGDDVDVACLGLKIAKKAWTQPDPIERPAEDSPRGSPPAPPSDEPPALGGAEPSDKKLKRRSSLSALLPQQSSPLSSPVRHESGMLLVSKTLSNPRGTAASGLFKSVSKTFSLSRRVSLTSSLSQREPEVLAAQQHDHDAEDASVVSVAVGVDLADVNLIIIGSCAEAAELLRKRRREGGRALLLWTNRPQQHAVQQRASNDSNTGLRRAKLNMASFVWSPPPVSGPASPIIHRMRKEHGCSATGMSRFGPDVLELRDVECYQVKVDDMGHECGIDVYNEMRGNLLWAVSGAVVFCGPSFTGRGQVVCSSIDEVQSLDVRVGFQEAMPLATTTTNHVLLAFLQNFLFLVVYFSIMKHFEANADSEPWPWWRLSWVLGPGFSMGALIYPRYWGMTLFGHQPPIWFYGLGAATFTACMGSLYLPVGWTVGFWSPSMNMITFSVFTVSSGGTIIYICLCVCVHLLSRRFAAAGEVPLDWYHHFAWSCAHIFTTLGTWIFLYGVSLLYVWMEMYFPQTAALFLAFSTSATEKAVSKILNLSYTTFIYTPRSSINGSRNIIGDQRRYLTIPVAMTHAYCEAVRLVSLLSVTVRSPSWAWLPSVLLNVSVNLMERTQLMLSLAVRMLPWCDWMCPGLSLVILHDVKLHTGYAQYVAVLALLVAEMVSGGFSLTSVFNMHCVILIVCCMVLEVLEDILVHTLPRSDYWRRRLGPYYEQQPLLHPKQLLLMDHRGPNLEAAPLALHGQRPLALMEVVALMWPSSLFTYVLMTLLLGAGYVHGVCPMPIPKEMRVFDALIWGTPLRCV